MLLPPPPPPAPPPLDPLTRVAARVYEWATRRPWHFAAAFTAAVFAVASVLPIWKSYYFGDWEINGEVASFWRMLVSFLIALEREPLGRLVFGYYGWNAVLLVVLLGVSLGVGRWLGGRVQATGPRSAARNRERRS